MTPEQEKLILALAHGADGRRDITPEQFLHRFGADDGKALGLSLLRDAIARQYGDGVELALIVSAAFGLTPEHYGLFKELCYADWHTTHEDVVSALGEWRDPDSVDTLLHMADWVPDYLDYDEARALATKAVWALGGIPGPEADRALERLREEDDPIVRGEAERQIARRTAQDRPRHPRAAG
ncbi:HEAT repeat domain-containing protein [Streptomyces sp. NPDC004134]|uniref:HEAT repeat domain-containing protein n=1 Tax=Streptomyces sp. NPDC004134 TaxID=3364691 RepID=UPI0036A04EDA